MPRSLGVPSQPGRDRTLLGVSFGYCDPQGCTDWGTPRYSVAFTLTVRCIIFTGS